VVERSLACYMYRSCTQVLIVFVALVAVDAEATDRDLKLVVGVTLVVASCGIIAGLCRSYAYKPSGNGSGCKDGGCGNWWGG
jgi:hypothetical protein